MFYYATGKDRAGNTLVTSYAKPEQAARYRAGARIEHGLRYLKISEDGTAKLEPEGEKLVRTLMIRPEDETPSEGRFVVWARMNGRWQETNFRYKTYAIANSAVKTALISLFPACAVIEE